MRGAPRRSEGKLLALAAVFDESKYRRRFAVITTAPNRTIAQVHDRMPAILPEETWKTWLDPFYPDYVELAGLLRPYPDCPLEIYPVSKLVNRRANDRPELIEPIGAMPRVEALRQKAYELFKSGGELRNRRGCRRAQSEHR